MEYTYPAPFVHKNAKPITRALLLGATAKKPVIHHTPYLTAMTHLQMSRKFISSLTEKDPKDPTKPILFGQCPNLKILYLEGNYLHDMKGALTGFKNLI